MCTDILFYAHVAYDDDWCEHQRFTGDKVKMDMHHKNPIPHILSCCFFILHLFSILFFILFLQFIVFFCAVHMRFNNNNNSKEAAPPTPKTTKTCYIHLAYQWQNDSEKKTWTQWWIPYWFGYFHCFVLYWYNCHATYFMSCLYAGKMTCNRTEKLKFTIIILCEEQSLRLRNQTDWIFHRISWLMKTEFELYDRRFYWNFTNSNIWNTHKVVAKKRILKKAKFLEIPFGNLM